MKTMKIIACIVAIIAGFALIGYGYRFGDNDIRLVLPTITGAVMAFWGIVNFIPAALR